LPKRDGGGGGGGGDPSSSSACTSAAAVFDTQGRTEDAKKSTQPLPFIPEIKKKGHKIKIKANNL
jgi:hypothetical protein